MEMIDIFKVSPFQQHWNDLEAGNILSCPAPSVDKLRRWREVVLVLIASRRFRYTLDLKKKEEKAANLLMEAAQKVKGTPKVTSTSVGDYGINEGQLALMTRDNDFDALEQCGGVKGLADMLKTNVEKGINGDNDDLLKRRNAFGYNTYPRKKGQGFWNFVWDACQHPILIILIIAAAASLGLGIKLEGIKEGWYDGGSIALAALIAMVVAAISDYKQYLQLQNLSEEKKKIIQLEVIRGGRRLGVSIYDLVVGDVVPLKIGDQVPADGILISGHSLAIDEARMTRETRTSHKGSKDPFLMSGCNVADGYGTMLVTSVGVNTKWGLSWASISEDTGEEIPFKVWLHGVAMSIGVVGLSVAAVVLVVLLIKYFSGHTKGLDGTVQFIAGKTKFITAIDEVIKIFAVAVTLVVLAVPDGLFFAYILMISYSMRKIMAEKALVKSFSACENMGSATTICVDTGMLTLNKMTLVEAYVGGKKIDPSDNMSVLPPMVKSLLIEGIAQNTTGSVFVPEGGGIAEVFGSPTEKAILQWGVNLGMNFDAIRSNSSIISHFPFNSEERPGSVVALKLPDSEIHIHCKGDAEIVLASCARYIDAYDNFQPMDENKVALFQKAIEDMAAKSLRCVAIAYRSYEMECVPTDEKTLAHWEIPTNDLVLLAIVGLKDPCRPDVKDAVILCQNAGVKVLLVTSDSLLLARTIAVECGILGSRANGSELIEGKTFGALSEVKRQEALESITVMARSSTSQKLLLVQELKKGHIVAVTWDSTNDVNALREANIGLAMGIQGTEVVKQSSDIIILDDNFASAVNVVRWGRSMYSNIQKSIQFQLTGTITALVVDFVCAVSSGDVPLNAVQNLWINLVMDTLGGLALANEAPTDSPMHRPPVKQREPLITNIMWRNILIQVIYQVTILLVINFQGESFLNHHSIEYSNKLKNAMTQNIFVICQIFNGFNVRKLDEINIFKGITRNRLFMVIVVLTLVLQVIIIEFLAKYTSSVRLNWRWWLVSFALGFMSWPVAVIGKLIPVPVNPISECFARSHLHRAPTSNH